MTKENRIIMPGDPGWDTARATEVAPPPEKLPDAVLEAAFSEVVHDVKAAVVQQSSEVPAVEPILVEPKDATLQAPMAPPQQPNISYKYHKPANKKSHDVAVPYEIKAELLEDLPKSWERKVYAKGQFRKGKQITITGFTYYPQIGNRFSFKEGAREGYQVRHDQIKMLIKEKDDDKPVESIGAERLPEASQQIEHAEGN